MQEELLYKYLCYLHADKFLPACHRSGTFKMKRYYIRTFCLSLFLS